MTGHGGHGGVVVTGAARGIGKAIARAFADAGVPVVAIDVNADGVQRTVSELPGEAHVAIAGDAGDEQLVRRACTAAIDSGGRLAAFIANAAIAGPGDSLLVTEQTWDRIMGVNLRAAFFGARTAASLMSDGGAIVMLSSISGHLGFGGRAVYSASKAGIDGLVRSLAVEWAPRNIRVNAVSPGAIATEMQEEIRRTGVTSADAHLSRIPMGRYGEPAEVAQAVLWLASELASFVTGAILPVDGGWEMNGLPNLVAAGARPTEPATTR